MSVVRMISGVRLLSFGLLALALLADGCGDNHETRTRVAKKQSAGSSATWFDIEGRRVNPFQAGDTKLLVFIFISNECPVSNRYAPEIRRLQSAFAPNGVAFWLVHPNRDESVEAIRRHTIEYGFKCGVVRDPEHTLVKCAQARVTPEAAIFLPDGQLLYHGRIDDRFVALGNERAAPTQHDLRDALEAALEGKPLARSNAPAIGCYIPEVP